MECSKTFSNELYLIIERALEMSLILSAKLSEILLRLLHTQKPGIRPIMEHN